MPIPSSSRRVTITDVARAAGVSIKTVSRVTNGVATVNPEMAQRVREAIEELGYRPNYLASQLKSGTSPRTIGFIAKDLSNTHTSDIFAGVATVARRHSAQVIAANTEESGSSTEDLRVAEELARRGIDGLVIMATGGDYSAFTSATFHGIPRLFVDRDVPGEDVVVHDDVDGAEKAMTALIARGHRRIAHLYSSMTIPTMRGRHLGVDAALRRAGHLRSQAPRIAGIMTRDVAAETVGHLLDSSNPPTAILCGSSEILFGCVRELLARGRQDVLVAAFGTERDVELLPLPVVLVETDGFDLGHGAANALFQRITRGGADTRRVVQPASVREVRPLGPSADG